MCKQVINREREGKGRECQAITEVTRGLCSPAMLVESAFLKEEAKSHSKHGDHVTLTAFVFSDFL